MSQSPSTGITTVQLEDYITSMADLAMQRILAQQAHGRVHNEAGDVRARFAVEEDDDQTKDAEKGQFIAGARGVSGEIIPKGVDGLDGCCHTKKRMRKRKNSKRSPTSSCRRERTSGIK